MRAKIASGLAWKVASQAFRQLSRVVVVVILARLLTPEEYGLAAMVLVFSALRFEPQRFVAQRLHRVADQLVKNARLQSVQLPRLLAESTDISQPTAVGHLRRVRGRFVLFDLIPVECDPPDVRGKRRGPRRFGCCM